MAELSAGRRAAQENLQAHWQDALRALQSLQTPSGVLASSREGHYNAIFGRDSLWTVLLALEAAKRRPKDTDYSAWVQELATTVLRGLAKRQGQTANDWNEEQRGKIIHECWDPVPEHLKRARFPLIDGCYYGSFDATFLYVITVGQVTDFFGELALLEELWPSLERAVGWMLEWSDADKDGIVEYARRNPDGLGLVHQIWKDSFDSVILPGEQPVSPPVAWSEVQGYAWLAYKTYEDLALKRKCLDAPEPQELAQRRTRLLQGLQRFWMADEDCHAIALDGQKQIIKAVSSNPGHLLWSGCLEKEQAEQTCTRLLLPDMLTPWGLRTLSEQAYYYNPLIYHRGTIWPFDNAATALGMQRYGFEDGARQIARSVLRAIQAFGTPVELYTVQPGHWIREPRIEEDWMLVDYHRACSVQAWTAAAVLYFCALLL